MEHYYSHCINKKSEARGVRVSCPRSRLRQIKILISDCACICFTDSVTHFVYKFNDDLLSLELLLAVWEYARHVVTLITKNVVMKMSLMEGFVCFS